MNRLIEQSRLPVVVFENYSVVRNRRPIAGSGRRAHMRRDISTLSGVIG